jgi:hypothetical protein
VLHKRPPTVEANLIEGGVSATPYSPPCQTALDVRDEEVPKIKADISRPRTTVHKPVASLKGGDIPISLWPVPGGQVSSKLRQPLRDRDGEFQIVYADRW